MNLHGIVSPAIGAVNPHVLVTLRVSNGYATSPDGTRTPTYDQYTDVPAQIQELTFNDLKLIEGLNVQGNSQVAYLNGRFEGVNRNRGTGGDLMITADGTVWKVTMVAEAWPDWVKLIVTQQVGPA